MIRLTAGQSAVFGYGSLLSLASLERTLGRPYTGPFVQSSLTGWRRTWDAAMPNRRFYMETDGGRLYPETILYLNVQRHPGIILNGIVFVVNAEELARYDERESIYERVDITDALDVPISGGSAFMYVCLQEHCLRDVRSPREGAVRATYLDTVESGLASLGPALRGAYNLSTDPPPQHLVIADKLDS